MEQMNILLCDDSEEQVSFLSKHIINYNKLKKSRIFNVYATKSSTEALNCTKSNTIHIAFLDIEIDDKTGIEIAKEIKKRNENTVIVFITSYELYAYEAYELHAFTYILKPISHKKVYEVLDAIIEYRVKSNFIKKYMLPKLRIKFKGEVSYVVQQDILYIEKCRKKVRIVANEAEYEYTATLKEMENQLNKDIFIRCHHGFIVNKSQIVSYKEFNLYLGSNKLCIPVSKSHLNSILDYLQSTLWESIAE